MMFDLSRLIRENIKTVVPYSSARSEYDLAGVYLDANELPWGEYNRYPDPFQTQLKSRLAEIKGVRSGNIFLGNGSDEIIDLLFRIFCEPNSDAVLGFSPSYGMYEVSANINAVRFDQLSLSRDFQIDPDACLRQLQKEAYKMIFICSPNNPTGNLLAPKSIERILEEFSGIVIIDEAYIDFSAADSWINRIDDFPNLLVLQTFSKAWGLAGLRIGASYSSKEIVDLLNKIKPPYNISRPSQELAMNALKGRKQFELLLSSVISDRSRLVEQLDKVEIVRKVYPTDANFLLVEVDDALEVYEILCSKGLIVRNRSSQIPNCLRLTVGSEIQNDLLINELKRISDAKSIVYR